jgi:predicted transcriptional regulator
MKQLLSCHNALESQMTGLKSHIASCNLSSQEIWETLSNIHQALGSMVPQIIDIQDCHASPDTQVMDQLEHLHFQMEGTEMAATDLNSQMVAQQIQITCMVATMNTLATSLEGQQRELLALCAQNASQSQEVQAGTSLAASPACPVIALLVLT